MKSVLKKSSYIITEDNFASITSNDEENTKKNQSRYSKTKQKQSIQIKALKLMKRQTLLKPKLKNLPNLITGD